MTCDLCDLPTPDPPVRGEDVEGSFCCRGCLEVARRLDPGEELDTGPDPDEAEGETAYLAVEGMHCATCEAFIESRATAREGVLAAEASYPADSVKVVYDPDAVDPDDLPGALCGLGYTARPIDEEPEDPDEPVGRLLVGGFFGMMVMVWYVLFLYPTYLGLPPEALLVDVTGAAGTYLLGNIWVMASVVLVYTGFPILRGAYVSLRAGHPDMDLLVALAAGTAYAYSTLALLAGRVEVYFDVSVAVVLVVTLGNYYESRLKRRAAGRLSDLTAERVSEARRRTASGAETVPVEDLRPGDEVVVRAGERIPADGRVVEGTAAVDESLVTGESLPARREPGDEAVGGAVVAEGGLVVEVGDDAASTLDRLVGVLWEVRASRPGVQRLADRLAAVFVPVVIALALAATAWGLLDGAAPTGALLTGLAVLVVSCPCALGLATPLAVSAGLRAALRSGVVLTDASAFERAPEVDVVAFDKTGTLTTGEMALLDSAGEGLERAAAVEALSDHPIAAAVTDAVSPPDLSVEGFENHPGQGVSGWVEGDRVLVGSEGLFAERGWAVPDRLEARYREARRSGNAPALVGWDGAARGVLVAGDRPREEWPEVVEALADAGRRVVVITGDGEAATAPFREHPAVDEVFAGVPPEAKAEVVERLRGEGAVAMVGDGINDAPALATADLGIALDRAALAADAADAVLAADDLRAVPAVFDLTAAAHRRIRENLGWAFGYNAVAVPLAVAGAINPLFAAGAMTASSLLVVANSSRPLPGEAVEKIAR